MSRRSICLCLLFGTLWSLVCSTPLYPCQTPHQEGSTAYLDCVSTILQRQITMQLLRDGAFVNVTTCTPDGSCDNLMPDEFTSVLIPEQVDGSTQYTNRLTIKSVSRYAATFKCLVDSYMNPSMLCDLQVYAPPSTPSCNQAVLVRDGTYLNLTCTTSNVYPSAILEVKDNGLSLPGNVKIERKYKLLTSPGNVTVEGEVLLSVSGWKPGLYQFEGYVYPNLSSIVSLADAEAKIPSAVASSRTQPYRLSAPIANISGECPKGPKVKNGYIMSGSEATCTCNLLDQGNPAGQARWYRKYDNSGTSIGNDNEVNRTSSLTLRYNPNDPNPEYECRGDTILDEETTSVKTLSPKFAVGPDAVTIEADSNQPLDKCPSSSTLRRMVTCKVRHEDVIPAPTFSILVDDDVVEEHKNGTLSSDTYEYRYGYHPDKAGDHRVTCRAENSLFPELNELKYLEFQVTEPPPSAPVLTIPNIHHTGGETADVPEGQEIAVTCQVDGGFPRVSKVTIWCGTLTTTVENKVAVLEMEVTENLDGQYCYCSATHASGCYDKEAKLMLRVSEPGSSSGNAVAIGVGVAVPLIIIIIIIVIIIVVVCLRRRKATAFSKKSGSGNAVNEYSIPDNDTSTKPNMREDYIIPYNIYDTIPESKGTVGQSSLYSFDFAPSPKSDGDYIQPI